MLGLLAALGSAGFAEAAPEKTRVQLHVENAVDGIFAAFRTRPVVLLGDAHHLAQEGAFYTALIRDRRFASDVGNLVVEFGGAAHQDVIDRYVNGESVPYEELRKVWTDLVGAETPASQMYSKVFATVRGVNAGLPPAKRIHIWLGEPPVDWSKLHSFDDLDPLMRQRDTYPAGLVNRQILDRGGKALVIYGSPHFLFGQLTPDVRELVESAHPGSTYLVLPYAGYARPGCSADFERHVRGWPTPALVSPVTGTWLAGFMVRCADPAGFRSPDPGLVARVKSALTGVSADARLYLGPVSSLTRDSPDESLYLDPGYVNEWNRTRACCLPPDVVTIDPDKILRDETKIPRPYDGPHP
jgi:hypothetical protein